MNEFMLQFNLRSCADEHARHRFADLALDASLRPGLDALDYTALTLIQGRFCSRSCKAAT